MASHLTLTLAHDLIKRSRLTAATIAEDIAHVLFPWYCVNTNPNSTDQQTAKTFAFRAAHAY